MEMLTIFGLQFTLSLVAWGVIVGVLLRPWLARREKLDLLLLLCLPHTFRHVGMVFLVPVVVGGEMPESFAGAAAYGDLTAGLLALLTVVALHNRWRVALPLAWLTNLVGLVDLANALRQADAVSSMGAAWYIPTMFVPLLLVTHVLMIRTLLTRTQSEPSSPPSELSPLRRELNTHQPVHKASK